jgi:hypothetical protein
MSLPLLRTSEESNVRLVSLFMDRRFAVSSGYRSSPNALFVRHDALQRLRGCHTNLRGESLVRTIFPAFESVNSMPIVFKATTTTFSGHRGVHRRLE